MKQKQVWKIKKHKVPSVKSRILIQILFFATKAPYLYRVANLLLVF